MTGITVEVCTKGGQCAACGVAPATAPDAWAKIECANGAITGNQIKISKMDNYLAFCEVEIRGKSEWYELSLILVEVLINCSLVTFWLIHFKHRGLIFLEQSRVETPCIFIHDHVNSMLAMHGIAVSLMKSFKNKKIWYVKFMRPT